MNAKGLMLVGLGMAALGGLLTLGSQSAASDNGGTYYVFTGLMVFGGFNFLRGLYYFIREQSRPTRTGRQDVTRQMNQMVQPTSSLPKPVGTKATEQASGTMKPPTQGGYREMAKWMVEAIHTAEADNRDRTTSSKDGFGATGPDASAQEPAAPPAAPRVVGKSASTTADASSPAIAEPPKEAPLAGTTAEFKICPDCAEQVRQAARTCRFCGFEFEGASVS